MSIMQTYTGRAFDLAAPHPDDICLDDIAHHLANQCRYTGATVVSWSIAQHSLLVAALLPAPLKFAGLLHDAHEAYTSDIATPFKRLINRHGNNIVAITEAMIDEAILTKWPHMKPADDFGRDAIKVADRMALKIEREHLLNPTTDEGLLAGWNEYLKDLPAIHPAEAAQFESIRLYPYGGKHRFMVAFADFHSLTH